MHKAKKKWIHTETKLNENYCQIAEQTTYTRYTHPTINGKHHEHKKPAREKAAKC